MTKSERHNKILELVKNYNIETQEELTVYLCKCGFDVTQATVSRDIKALKLVKVAAAANFPGATVRKDAGKIQTWAKQAVK